MQREKIQVSIKIEMPLNVNLRADDETFLSQVTLVGLEPFFCIHHGLHFTNKTLLS